MLAPTTISPATGDVAVAEDSLVGEGPFFWEAAGEDNEIFRLAKSGLDVLRAGSRHHPVSVAASKRLNAQNSTNLVREAEETIWSYRRIVNALRVKAYFQLTRDPNLTVERFSAVATTLLHLMDEMEAHLKGYEKAIVGKRMPGWEKIARYMHDCGNERCIIAVIGENAEVDLRDGLVPDLSLLLPRRDLRRLMGMIFRVQKSYGDETGVRVEFALPPTLSGIEFESQDRADAFIRIMSNLISNGIKYHNRSLAPDERWVRVEFSEIPGGLVIDVSDNGRGMTQSFLTRKYGKNFQRAKEAAVLSIPGSGLGVSSVLELIREMNGIFEVSSSRNKGTQVRLTLPAQNFEDKIFESRLEKGQGHLLDAVRPSVDSSQVHPDPKNDRVATTALSGAIAVFGNRAPAISDEPDLHEPLSPLFNIVGAANPLSVADIGFRIVGTSPEEVASPSLEEGFRLAGGEEFINNPTRLKFLGAPFLRPVSSMSFALRVMR